MNQMKGEVLVQLDGKDYILRPTFDAVCKIEGILDIGVQGMLKLMMEQNMSLKMIEAILYCGLEAGENKVPRDELRSKLMMGGTASFIPVCIQFMTNALTGSKQESSDEEEKKT